MSDVQTAASHRRWVPGYHFVASSLVLIYLGWSIYTIIFRFSLAAMFQLLMAMALAQVFYYTRVFALAAQDRVIRLEERLRLAQLLPDDLQSRVNDFTTDQLIGLRFASDDELPALAAGVLDDGANDREGIKKMIKEWRPDEQRV